MLLLGLFGLTEIIIICLICIFLVMLPIFALIDILVHEFRGNNKLIWVIVVLFVGLLGPLLYFTIGRKQQIHR